MDRRAIGVFDSGLGGLTAAKVLEDTLPCENLIYFGDTANMPYGPRRREELVELATWNAGFLLQSDVKAILVACGTVSSNAMAELRERFDVPFFGVIDSACLAAAEATESGRVGVIATEASIRSGAYRRTLESLGRGLRVFDAACPSFVPLVESGHTDPRESIVRSAVEEELRALKKAGVDTLILGCTHYPLLEEAIAGYMGLDVHLISCGGEAALALGEFLHREDMLSPRREKGRRRYFTSGDAEEFGRRAAMFLGHEVKAEKAR